MAEHPLSPGACTLALLDTCVLLPSRLSDVLFDLMLAGLYDAHWTFDVESEFLRNWHEVHPESQLDAGQRRLAAFQRATRQSHAVFGYEADEYKCQVPEAVHANDRHLVAAALVLQAAADEAPNSRVVIVSRNTRHLAVQSTRKLGIDIMTPGVFIDSLYDAAPSRVLQAIAQSLSDLKKPPYTPDQLARALRLHGIRKLAQALV